MSNAESTLGPGVPSWTLADRLRKAREYAGLKQEELAARIGISRRSVTNYEHGIEPRRPVRLSWALACGVAFGWLETGELEDGPDRGPEQGGSPTIWETVSQVACNVRPIPLRRAA